MGHAISSWKTSDNQRANTTMWEKLRALFKGRTSEEQPSRRSTRRRQSDPFGGLSEVSVPPPIQNRDDSQVYRHHTLEENVRRKSRGEDIDAEDDEDILVRHHTLEENLELAEELGQEMRRQSRELRRLSTERKRASFSEVGT
ncbi:hypothetical protein LTS06_011741 [Exophiala xenobiotica]|nr:hypothetical protein LTS06_011741 [Exophiala xenobiotica]